MTRMDETHKRLIDWTYGQLSERLAAQVLIDQGYENLDPSHPCGGKDGGLDGICTKDGRRFVMAVSFPRGQQDFSKIKSKFLRDVDLARRHSPEGVAFVTNQEIKLAERKVLQDAAEDLIIDLFHLERVALVLDQPHMGSVRQQFLDIPASVVYTAAQERRLKNAEDNIADHQRAYVKFVASARSASRLIDENIAAWEQGREPPAEDVQRVREWINDCGEINARIRQGQLGSANHGQLGLKVHAVIAALHWSKDDTAKQWAENEWVKNLGCILIDLEDEMAADVRRLKSEYQDLLEQITAPHRC